MLKFDFSPFPVLTTERLILRAATLDDAPDYLELRSDPRVVKYLASPLAREVADTEKIIAEEIKSRNANTAISWVITLKGNPKMRGTIGFYKTQFEHFRTEIGYKLSPDLWGKGIMSEAIRAVLDYIFW